MKKIIIKCFILFLVSLLVFNTFAVTCFAANNSTIYKNWKTIEYGSYPQSRLVDDSIIDELNKIEKSWKSYGYITGENIVTDGWSKSYQSDSLDHMVYCDVELNGDKYRGVYFDYYRSPSAAKFPIACSFPQEDSGYYRNIVYWFKYEPLTWLVLDEKSGLVVSLDIIDSQPFVDSYYKYEYIDSENCARADYYSDSSCNYFMNNYNESYIKAWLNENFYDITFSKNEKNNIENVEFDTKGYGLYEDPPVYVERYNTSISTNKVFLLSVEDLLKNNNGFSTSIAYDICRRAAGSDYSYCMGLSKVNSDYYSTTVQGKSPSAEWMLRNGGNESYSICQVYLDGSVAESWFDNTDIGIRPAMILSSIKNCSCNCHKSGFMGFIWKIQFLFYKLFKTHKICECGIAHY